MTKAGGKACYPLVASLTTLLLVLLQKGTEVAEFTFNSQLLSEDAEVSSAHWIILHPHLMLGMCQICQGELFLVTPVPIFHCSLTELDIFTSSTVYR